MSVAKVAVKAPKVVAAAKPVLETTSEVTATSRRSFENAVKKGLKRAAKAHKGITGALLADQKVTLKRGKVAKYHVTMRVTVPVAEVAAQGA